MCDPSPMILVLIRYSLSNKSTEILKHLSKRGSPWPNACEAAIRDLFARFHQDYTSVGHSESTHITTEPGKSVNPADAAATSTTETHLAAPGFQSDHGYSTLPQSQMFGDAYLDTMLPSANSLAQPDLSLFEGFDIPFWLDESLFADTLNVT